MPLRDNPIHTLVRGGRGENAGSTSAPPFDKIRMSLTGAHLICHCEERSDVAILMTLNTGRRTAVATATRLPRYARNDKVGTRGQDERGNLKVRGHSTGSGRAWKASWVRNPKGPEGRQ